jgi:hypothetical protein
MGNTICPGHLVAGTEKDHGISLWKYINENN